MTQANTADNASICDEDAEQDKLLSTSNRNSGEGEERPSGTGPCSYESAQESFAKDPFNPFPLRGFPAAENEQRILTFRALLVGISCGALVNASNIYLGLRAGWTSSANIFGSIIGFAVLKSWSSYFAPSSILGGFFGPQENNIVQTAATAAGGLASVFVSAFPAMYQLNLLDTPWKDFLRVTVLTAAGGYFGLFFATPLRKFFIFQVAKELNLVFPSSSATAITISGMHLAAGGSQLARHKMVALVFAFVFALMLRVISQYAPGILWDWHFFTWLALSGVLPSTMFAIQSWGWFIEWTPAFIGTGMLVDMNVALSFVFGSVLAWGIVGPIITKYGLAFGEPVSTDSKWDGLISYISFSKEFANATHPSPRYWLLWPGVACMIVVGFTELACQWKVFWLTGLEIYKACKNILSQLHEKQHEYKHLTEENEGPKSNRTTKGEIKTWMWLPGLIAVLILTCVVSKLQFEIPVSSSILSLVLAFTFSVIAIQSTGATDITPLSAISKASQLVLGATTRGPEWKLESSQRVNLLGGALASIGASQACDLTGDFRVGFLLNTPPSTQYAAQAIGTFFAVFLAPAVFSVFASAYPCILSTGDEPHSKNGTTSLTCPFTAPAASAWRAAAVAVTDPEFPVPKTSVQFSIVMAAIGSVVVLIRHHLWTGKWAWMRDYHPNMMPMAMAFLIPTTQYSTAMLIGTTIAMIWKRRDSGSFGSYAYAVAAGFMAGEGIGGVINTALTIIGVDGARLGTNIGCPGGIC
ncbi:hypothetical protein MGYG_05097 [Nannizzia gypsea CBS 118893]|uniref:Oligopeptide transporter n=1 Tax=Arthroderma gypseum (strain ATCC MYA-4604 / CBS 118893) TaxID=535722 RepID=E4UYD2_ARTGP|nr:hypothetical protein MGYG_05097 [Nannizzia gypsea CBS 118893]EFR02095.1 hypothetical protein MGYG_05097 [Nannizzia gypsea CBS 118893]